MNTIPSATRYTSAKTVTQQKHWHHHQTRLNTNNAGMYSFKDEQSGAKFDKMSKTVSFIIGHALTGHNGEHQFFL